MNGKTIYHVSFGDDAHLNHYFGSIAAIYDQFSAKELGITYQSLRHYGLTVDKPYKNKVCIIRKGIIHRKSTNRRKPQ